MLATMLTLLLAGFCAAAILVYVFGMLIRQTQSFLGEPDETGDAVGMGTWARLSTHGGRHEG